MKNSGLNAEHVRKKENIFVWHFNRRIDHKSIQTSLHLQFCFHVFHCNVQCTRSAKQQDTRNLINNYRYDELCELIISTD